jgi:nucleoid-associated protein YgaU
VTLYRVKRGDSLSRIGARFGLTWGEVYSVNLDRIRKPDLIFPGQVLAIP